MLMCAFDGSKPATPRPGVAGWLAPGLLAAGLLLAGACAPAGEGAAPAPVSEAPAAPRPVHVERLTNELNGIPGAGVVQVFRITGEIDVEYTLFHQRVRWTASAPPEPITAQGLGWADYRGRCHRERGGGTGRLVCIAPFDYFFPYPAPEGGQCYSSMELEEDLCPGQPETHGAVQALFQLGGELARHAATGESFAPFRERLRRTFAMLLDLREKLQPGGLPPGQAEGGPGEGESSDR